MLLKVTLKRITEAFLYLQDVKGVFLKLNQNLLIKSIFFEMKFIDLKLLINKINNKSLKFFQTIYLLSLPVPYSPDKMELFTLWKRKVCLLSIAE